MRETPARTRLIAIAAAGVLLIVIGIGRTVFGGDGEEADPSAARAALEAAGCTLRLVTAVPNKSDHSDVKSPDEISPEWNTDPPTSGPHWGETAVYGIYTEPLQQARVVHNLEHGGAFIQYGGDVFPAEIEKIAAFYDDHKEGTLVAPYPVLEEKIALGAWIAGKGRGQGVLALCTHVDRKAFTAFFDAFQFKGNERFPASSMLPGSN
ncbi:MAG: DUF3105 domain-containing protein [Gaiellales bacterium]